MSKWLIVLAILALAGCSTIPDSLQVDENDQALVTYAQVATSPDISANKTARWGGVIANVENKADATLVEVVHYPLRTYGRPSVSKESVGRFRVYVNGFLDPMVFTPGRAMTFAGQVIGVEEGIVGEHAYQYPTLQASGYHLWRDTERVDVQSLDPWGGAFVGGWGAGWGPGWGPGWRGAWGPGFYGRPFWGGASLNQRYIIRREGYHGGRKVEANPESDPNAGNSGAENMPSVDYQPSSGGRADNNIQIP